MTAPAGQAPVVRAPAWAESHLRPGEEVLWWTRPSLYGLAPILTSAALGVLVLYLTVRFDVREPGAILTGTPAVVLAVGGILVEAARKFVRLRYTTFIITRERIYAITTFLTTNARSVPLSRASLVTVRQGPAGRLLGFWHAHVTTYGDGAQSIAIPAIRDGEGLLRQASAGLRRGANASWLLRGD